MLIKKYQRLLWEVKTPVDALLLKWGAPAALHFQAEGLTSDPDPCNLPFLLIQPQSQHAMTGQEQEPTSEWSLVQTVMFLNLVPLQLLSPLPGMPAPCPHPTWPDIFLLILEDSAQGHLLQKPSPSPTVGRWAPLLRGPEVLIV